MRAAEADRARVLHMLDAIRQLEGSPGSASEKELDADPMLRFGTVKLIEIIGEAANMLTKQLRAAHPEVPCLWSSACGIAWCMTTSGSTPRSSLKW